MAGWLDGWMDTKMETLFRMDSFFPEDLGLDRMMGWLDGRMAMFDKAMLFCCTGRGTPPEFTGRIP